MEIIMGNKEDCAKFFKKVLGLEFTEEELDAVWAYLEKNKFTPTSPHGGNTIGFTPQMLKEFINISLQRTNTTLQDPKYKKVVEEILPALIFTVFLKKSGFGEFLVVSSDTPDIMLVNFNKEDLERKTPRAKAIPIEAIYIPQSEIDRTAGNTSAEKIAKIVVEKKFIKSYISSTSLLITLNAEVVGLNLPELSNILLKNSQNKFNDIWIFLGTGKEKCILARLTPSYSFNEINIDKDITPLFY